MLSAPSYPATLFEPSPLPDLFAKTERERLSPSAIKAFLNIMEKWRVRDEDARALLRGVSNGQFYDMKKKPERTLDADTLTRISYLVGIFKALNTSTPGSSPMPGCSVPLPTASLPAAPRLPIC